MCFSKTHWELLFAPFYLILFATSYFQDNSPESSPIMPEAFGEHLTRDQRPFLHTESPKTHSFRVQVWTLGWPLQMLGFVLSDPFLFWFWCLFLDHCPFWRSKHGPLYDFKHRLSGLDFLSVEILSNPWCHVSEQDVQDLWQKIRPTALKIQPSISFYTWDTFLSLCHLNERI